MRDVPPESDFGVSAAPAGDVNADGHADVIVGAPNFNRRKGLAYILFGPLTTGGGVDLADLEGRGFAIGGAAPEARLGTSVDGAGDVNGDGFDDLVVGAPAGYYSGDPRGPGAVFVVFGKQDSQPVNVSDLADRGFALSSAPRDDEVHCQGEQLGDEVSGAGHFNADGFEDILVSDSGNCESFVVFGKPDSASVELQTADPTQALTLTADPDDFSRYLGSSLDGGADVNGDGRDDVIVGDASLWWPPDQISPPAGGAGAAHVVFGGPGGRVALAELESTGRGFTSGGRTYEIEDRYSNYDGDKAGSAVAMIGDVNRDGRADVAIGAPQAASPDYVPRPPSGDVYDDGDPETNFAGSVFTVFGKADTEAVALHSLGPRGYRVPVFDGEYEAYGLGTGLSAAGDLDADGVPDFVAMVGWGYGRERTAYAVYGTSVQGTVPLAPAGPGFRVRPLPVPLVGVGDQSGDGRPDLLAGDLLITSPPPPLRAGRCSNIVWGAGGEDELAGTQAGDRISGFAGDDRIEGLSGADCIRGGPGRDELLGDEGHDRFRGGSGRDRIRSADGLRDRVRCGRGRDRARVDSLDRLFGCERVRRLSR